MKIETAILPQDLTELRKVAEQAFSSSPDSSIDRWFSFDEMIMLLNRKLGICLKALDEDGEVIGMTFAQQESPVNGQESKEKWVIVIAAVTPEYTRQGVGSALLKALEEYVARTGANKLFVFTNNDDEQVISFYHHNNYEDAGWIKDYQYGRGNSAVWLLKYLIV